MIDKDAKLHNDFAWMQKKFVEEGLTVGEISNLLNISSKLVILKLKEHGLF